MTSTLTTSRVALPSEEGLPSSGGRTGIKPNKTVLGILAAGALLASVPWLGVPAFYESFLYLICHWMILALSWNMLSGYSGYFSFGHGAFFGIGMYTSAGLAANLNWP